MYKIESNISIYMCVCSIGKFIFVFLKLMVWLYIKCCYVCWFICWEFFNLIILCDICYWKVNNDKGVIKGDFIFCKIIFYCILYLFIVSKLIRLYWFVDIIKKWKSYWRVVLLLYWVRVDYFNVYICRFIGKYFIIWCSYNYNFNV